MSDGRPPGHLEIGHLRARRPFPEAIEELFHLRPRSFHFGLNSTIRKISHPAAEAEPLSLLLSKGAIADPLHPSGYEDFSQYTL